MTALVSIVTATYNSETFVTELYNSLCAQEYKTWEWCVTDDCSSDSTVDVIRKIAEADPRVTLEVLDKNSGAGASRNKSVQRARGEFLAFVDSDDWWAPNKLSRQLDFMNSNKLDFTFTGYQVSHENGRLGNLVDCSGKYTEIGYTDLLRKSVTLGCSTVMLRRASFSKIEFPLIRTGQDYVLWLSLLKERGSASLLPEPLTYYRIHKGGISRNKFKKALRQWNIYRQIEKLGIIQSSICFCYYAWRAINRK